MNFEIHVPGKWILCGEHAVLRGFPALVFPLASRSLNFSFVSIAGSKQLKLILSGEHGQDLSILFWGVLERACELRNVRRSDLEGEISIASSLPVGAGLGASAALCVAVGRWFESRGFVPSSQLAEFSRILENIFHGESSGVDIAVVLSQLPLRFVRQETPQIFKPQWQPKWFISYSGQRGVTMECVNKVKKLFLENPTLGKKLDLQMGQSEQLAEKALSSNVETGMRFLIESIQLAGSCFEGWGLTAGALQNHMDDLVKRGALAVKPTGSGAGGYVLSVWLQDPPTDLGLIPC